MQVTYKLPIQEEKPEFIDQRIRNTTGELSQGQINQTIAYQLMRLFNKSQENGQKIFNEAVKCNKDIENLTNQISQMDKQLRENFSLDLQKQVDGLKADLAIKLDAAKRVHDNNLNNLASRVDVNKNTCDGLRTDVNDLKTEKDRQKSELEQQKEKVTDIQNKVNEQKQEVDRLKVKVDAGEAKVAEQVQADIRIEQARNEEKLKTEKKVRDESISNIRIYLYGKIEKQKGRSGLWSLATMITVTAGTIFAGPYFEGLCYSHAAMSTLFYIVQSYTPTGVCSFKMFKSWGKNNELVRIKHFFEENLEKNMTPQLALEKAKAEVMYKE